MASSEEAGPAALTGRTVAVVVAVLSAGIPLAHKAILTRPRHVGARPSVALDLAAGFGQGETGELSITAKASAAEFGLGTGALRIARREASRPFSTALPLIARSSARQTFRADRGRVHHAGTTRRSGAGHGGLGAKSLGPATHRGL